MTTPQPPPPIAILDDSIVGIPKAHHQAIAMPPLSTPLMPVQATLDDDMSFNQQRPGFHHSNHSNTFHHSNEQHEARQTQYYGAAEGDESGDLCPLMLQVVLDLFDGVDYEDP
ncbi:unnamed protein product [Aureobasidium vineae]|uniref:Uncharacterized protein n=1 Tax=Aureobasidium vineae TaxID=2773715 RepID=A0A9N8JP86_9PEZI|nr:unnamed protein product [Aureobasidium vineae]